MKTYVKAGAVLACLILVPPGRADAAAVNPPTGEVRLAFHFNRSQLSFSRHRGYDVAGLQGGYVPNDSPGMPALPAVFVNVLVPAGADVLDVSAEADEVPVRSAYRPYPIQPEVPRGWAAPPFAEPDPALNRLAGKYPAAAAEGRRAQRLRGHTIVPVRLSPLRFEPATRLLFLAREIRLTVTYSQPVKRPAALRRGHALARRMVDALVVNPDQPGAEPDLTESAAAGTPALRDLGDPFAPCDYLVITKASLTNAFKALTDHRAAFNGFSTEVISTEWIEANYDGLRPDGGTDTQTRVRNCIRDFVDTRGVSYVVLGGDNTIVPDRDCLVICGSYSNTTCPADLYYAGLDGTWDDVDADGIYGEANVTSTNDEGDLVADVFVGRIPVRTAAQASNYIAKVVRHDSGPPYRLLHKFLMGGVKLWNTYTNTGRPSDAMNDGHLAFRDEAHPIVSDAEMWARRTFRDCVQAHGWTASDIGCAFDTLTSWDTALGGDYPIPATNLAKRFNQGWYFLIFDTHGGSTTWSAEGSSFSSTHASALTGKTAFVYTMACNSGGFDSADPSLSEAFLRATNGGALIYIGSSRYGWGATDSPPASDYSTGGSSPALMRKFLDIVLRDGVNRVAQAFFLHKAAFIASSSSYGSYRWLQCSLNLQGDPALDILEELPVVSLDSPSEPMGEAAGLTGQVVFTRSGPLAGELAVRYSRGGSATCGAGEDYLTSPETAAEGDFMLPSGSNTIVLAVAPADDAAVEGNETVLFALAPDPGYTLGATTSALLTIVEDDHDGDGMPDDWENHYGLDDDIPAPDGRSDSDPFTDFEEYIAGTDPSDGDSFLRLEAVTGPGDFGLSFDSIEGREYRVEWTESLVEPVWQELVDEVPGSGETMAITDPVPDSSRYYRLQASLP